jgi:hypothetical protein
MVARSELGADLVVRERVYGSNSLWYVQGPGTARIEDGQA